MTFHHKTIVMSLQPEKVKSDMCAEFVSCNQLADQFTTRYHVTWRDTVMKSTYRYDLPTSLNGATRDRRQGVQPVIAYHITNATQIANVPLKRLLSHVKTNMEPTSYLAHAEQKQMVVAWGSQCRATHRNVSLR